MVRCHYSRVARRADKYLNQPFASSILQLNFGNLQFKHESLRYFYPQWITIWDGAILLMHVYLLYLILGIRNCHNELELTRKFLKIVEKTVKNNKWKSLPFRSFKKMFRLPLFFCMLLQVEYSSIWGLTAYFSAIPINTCSYVIKLDYVA